LDASFSDLGNGAESLTISNNGINRQRIHSGLYFNLNTKLQRHRSEFSTAGGSADSAATEIWTDAIFQSGRRWRYDILFNSARRRASLRSRRFSDLPDLGNRKPNVLDFDYLSAPAGGPGLFWPLLMCSQLAATAPVVGIRPTDSLRCRCPNLLRASLLSAPWGVFCNAPPLPALR